LAGALNRPQTQLGFFSSISVEQESSVRAKQEKGAAPSGGRGPVKQAAGTSSAVLKDSARQQAVPDLVKYMTAVEKCSDLIMLMDAEGVIEYVNPVFELVTGYRRDEVVGMNRSVLIPTGADGVQTMPPEADFGSSDWHGTVRLSKKDGGSFLCKSSVYPIKTPEDIITNYLSVSEDITEQIVSGEKLQYLTRCDGTTGLTNRGWFIKCLNDWIDSADEQATGALFLFDLDQFKFISDSFGHGMGDELLRRVGKLLQIMLRYLNSRYLKEQVGESLLSRLSGDEFAVFLPSVGRVESVTIAEQIRKGLEDFYQPDAQCHLTASIGVAFFPEHGKTSAELLTRADSAMYRAKDLGRNRFHFYSPEEHGIERMHLRLQRKEEILKALKEDRFEPWYQPILDLKDSTVKHYEVLARMRDRDGKVILPGPFIDIAERFGLVSHIARLITEKALVLQAEMKSRGFPLTFCINVSGKELGDKEFLYYLQSKIYETGADPKCVIFEITETASVHDLDRAMEFINALKSMGCRISLDDFGIGFTSFLYLKEMNVDYIKIAGSFIKNLRQNVNDQLFVKAISDVAGGMGIKTIAEFVECEELVPVLKSYGIDYAQGYAIGRPAPAPEYKGQQNGITKTGDN